MDRRQPPDGGGTIRAGSRWGVVGGLDTTRPHSARRYDYWLGGKDNFAADRISGDEIAAAFPTIRTAAVENRLFLRRAVTVLARECGVTQFLDIGTGIPTAPNTHQVAQSIVPAARVVYVDNDPIVMAHARALLTGDPAGQTAHVHADLRQPGEILDAPQVRDTLDLSRPVGLVLAAVLHFIDEAGDPYGCVGTLVDALPSGSVVVVSHATLNLLPTETAVRLSALVATGGHGTFQPRTRDEVARFTAGLHLLDPGVVPVPEWRPDVDPPPAATADQVGMFAAAGVKS